MKKMYVGFLAGLIVLAGALPCRADKIVVVGSTTVLPIAQKAAETFMQQNPSADISVRGGGSGVGIASIIQGTCNIGDASRAIKESELQTAAVAGRDIKAHVIAMDGIAVVVNPANSVKALTKQQVKDIFTGKISDWSMVGGVSAKIVVISRDSSSGTFEAFGELALHKEKVRADALMQASNQAVASTVARTLHAIGYVGLGFMNEGVKPVELGGVMPSKESVLTGKYPLGRPLFMYTNGVPQGLTKDFIDYIKSSAGQQLVEGEGFVGLK